MSKKHAKGYSSSGNYLIIELLFNRNLTMNVHIRSFYLKYGRLKKSIPMLLGKKILFLHIYIINKKKTLLLWKFCFAAIQDSSHLILFF